MRMHSRVPPSGVRDTTSARRVLVVDDDDDSRELLCDVLRSRGHEPRGAARAEDALAFAAEFQPHVALIDIGLHGMDGYELARRLRLMPELEACRLVATTGYTHPEAIAHGAAAGFQQHLTKPMSIADVLAAVIEGGQPEEAAR